MNTPPLHSNRPLNLLTSNLLTFLLVLLTACRPSAERQADRPVVLFSGADPRMELAAKEVRRYFYLRTGELLDVQPYTGQTLPKKMIWLMVKGDKKPVPLFTDNDRTAISQLGSESYLIRSSKAMAGDPSQYSAILEKPGSQGLIFGSDRIVILGGSPQGTLYGAYAFAEKLGLRFYLHGDVIPDKRIKPELPVINETGTPLFETRGIQPFHDFPEGPDWWTLQDYKAYFAQMVKMKMNFFGLHTYPEGGVGPEPLVWIGLKDQVNPDGTVKTAYQSRHFTTMNGTWGYTAKPTSQYSNHLGDLFEDDSYSTDYMIGTKGWPADEQAEIDLFNRTGKFFGEAFRYARGLGLKTCVGTETPLIVPKRVRERNPKATTFDYYSGMFEWVKRNYPIDYYWYWTPEDWTWSGNTPELLKATVDDLAAAQKAVEAAGSPFQLATCGWVLGPVQDRSMFDQFLPKSWPMSCINQQVGFTPVDPGFARVKSRPLWAIPWMEDDPALTSMQLWAGRMRADAADALAYGCTGLIGIHWRTKPLQTTVSALANAGWERVTSDRVASDKRAVTRHSSLVTPEEAEANFKRTPRDLPVDDFYADWALAQFGPEVADSMARLMVSVDGQEVSINAGGGKKTRLPRQGDWTGPGGVVLDTLTWEQRQGEYAFVDRMAKWRGRVKGTGNLERFDYWLNFFRYHRAFGKFSCSLGETERLLKQAEKSGPGGASAMMDQFVKQRTKLIGIIDEALGYLLAFASTPGDLGNIANWEQHLMVYNVGGQAERIEKATGRKLPPEAIPSSLQLKLKKMIVPTVRTQLNQGEDLSVRLLLYGIDPAKAVVRFRPLGAFDYREITFEHLSRGVYRAVVPAGSINGDFEYCVLVKGRDSNEYLWPMTANGNWQTVVVMSR